ncbi:MAG: ATP synthase F1 subunit gamma [Bacteroidota bacterium]
MASLRDIRDRIKTVRSTQQVTRAMKMVAAAKLRRAQEQIFNSRPYAYKLREITVHLAQQVDPGSHPLFQRREEVNATLLVIVTADRGLAGAFNANVIKTAEATIRERYTELNEAGNLYLMCVGRKSHEYFSKRGYQLIGDYRGVFNSLSFKDADEMTDVMVEGFEGGRWDEVQVVYNEFKNTISQNRIVEPLLPVPQEAFATPVMEASDDYHEAEVDANRQFDYIFEPDAGAILQELVPRFVTFQFWRVLLESNAAEQGARMVAMDNATTNAGELLKDLKLTYNQARQAAITTEILEIVSGAEALKNG